MTRGEAIKNNIQTWLKNGAETTQLGQPIHVCGISSRTAMAYEINPLPPDPPIMSAQACLIAQNPERNAKTTAICKTNEMISNQTHQDVRKWKTQNPKEKLLIPANRKRENSKNKNRSIINRRCHRYLRHLERSSKGLKHLMRLPRHLRIQQGPESVVGRILPLSGWFCKKVSQYCF